MPEHSPERAAACVNALAGVPNPEKLIQEVNYAIDRFSNKRGWCATEMRDCFVAIAKTLGREMIVREPTDA